jgi:hypothetical protein
MIRIFFISILSLALSAEKCNEAKSNGNKVYKGRLEIKALCYNYTLKLLEGDIDRSLIESSWTNESTGKTYTNVFGLADPCDFPKTINEGDSFNFVIDSSKSEPCIVCMAYYPHPTKRLRIKVVGNKQ